MRGEALFRHFGKCFGGLVGFHCQWFPVPMVVTDVPDQMLVDLERGVFEFVGFLFAHRRIVRVLSCQRS